MNMGLFITLEGPDGSVKSTQIGYLKDFSEANNIECIFTREPGGTHIGEKLRNIILDNENSEMCDMTEALLYAASRAQHVEEVIKPALKEGKVVVCDRFIDSSIAYQGYGRCLGDLVRVINEYAVGDCMPDITFLMKLSPAIGRSRIDTNDLDRLEQEKLEFHNKVYEGYLKIAEHYRERFVCVDAQRDKEAVRDDIIAAVEKAIKAREVE